MGSWAATYPLEAWISFPYAKPFLCKTLLPLRTLPNLGPANLSYLITHCSPWASNNRWAFAYITKTDIICSSRSLGSPASRVVFVARQGPDTVSCPLIVTRWLPWLEALRSQVTVRKSLRRLLCFNLKLPRKLLLTVFWMRRCHMAISSKVKSGKACNLLLSGWYSWCGRSELQMSVEWPSNIICYIPNLSFVCLTHESTQCFPKRAYHFSFCVIAYADSLCLECLSFPSPSGEPPLIFQDSAVTSSYNITSTRKSEWDRSSLQEPKASLIYFYILESSIVPHIKQVPMKCSLTKWMKIIVTTSQSLWAWKWDRLWKNSIHFLIIMIDIMISVIWQAFIEDWLYGSHYYNDTPNSSNFNKNSVKCVRDYKLGVVEVTMLKSQWFQHQRSISHSNIVCEWRGSLTILIFQEANWPSHSCDSKGTWPPWTMWQRKGA